MTEDDEAVNRLVVRRVAGTEAGTPCPDANLLVGFVEGTLLPAEEESVGAHVSDCANCREALGEVEAPALEAAPEESALADRPQRVRRWPAYAAAAALLLAVGAAAWLLRGQDEEPRADTATRLVAAARDLARERPELFQDFVPFDPAQRPAGGNERERGGIRLLAPSDVVLSTRPTFRWAAAPGTKNHEVGLETAGGAAVWKRAVASNEVAYPEGVAELTRGTRYEWALAFDGVLGGRTESRRRFAVASPDEVQAFEDASRAIAAHVAADLRDLLLAQFALRRGLVAEAERLARAHVARNPSDAVGRATLRHVLLVQGSAEAAAYEDGGR